METLNQFIAPLDSTIKAGWKKLGDNGFKVLFVVDHDGVICGSLTDGDVRRWILAEKPITDSLTQVIKKDPIVLKEGYNPELAKKIMLESRIECIPIVDAVGRPRDLLFWDQLFKSQEAAAHEKLGIPVVIMAGGRGVRLDPFTKVLPKPLIPVGDKPIIEIIIEKFREYDVSDFYLSLNYRSNMIKAYFQDLNPDYNLHYVEETQPSGTAGSLHLLKDKIKTTFMVSNCDIIIEANYADILKFHRESKNKITLVCSMRHFPIPYGIVEIENGGTLKEIREKPEFDFLVNTGLYVLEPDLLARIPKDKFYHITHLIEQLRCENERVGVYPIASNSWADIGELKAYQESLEKFQKL